MSHYAWNREEEIDLNNKDVKFHFRAFSCRWNGENLGSAASVGKSSCQKPTWVIPEIPRVDLVMGTGRAEIFSSSRTSETKWSRKEKDLGEKEEFFNWIIQMDLNRKLKSGSGFPTTPDSAFPSLFSKRRLLFFLL